MSNILLDINIAAVIPCRNIEQKTVTGYRANNL